MLVVEVTTGTEEDAGEDTGAEDVVADEDAGTEAEVAVMRVVGVAASPVVRKTPPVGVLGEGVSLVSVTGIMLKTSELDIVLAASVDEERVSEGLCEEVGTLVEEVTYISVVDVAGV